MADDKECVFFMMIAVLCIIIGFCLGNYSASFTIPTAKIWNHNRSYDHILIDDGVICSPINERNATYYSMNILVWNDTDYILSRYAVPNTTAHKIVVCSNNKQ